MIHSVPHRHLVFALPKILRPAFRHRRRLLPELALCVWKALSAFLREDTGNDTLPAAIVSIQMAGEFLNWHPHLHVLAPAGAFRTDGVFVHSPVFDAAVLRDLFQANVLALLLKERMISQELVERMREWRHSGFHAYTGEEIPDTEDALRVVYMVRGPAGSDCCDPETPMRLLVIADIEDLRWEHGVGEADILLSCGDVSDHVIMKAADAFKCHAIFAVKGNHDSADPFPEPTVDLHRSSKKWLDVTFGGLNGARKYKPRGHYLALTRPPKPLHRHKGNSSGVRTDCKPRANNCHFVGLEGVFVRGW